MQKNCLIKFTVKLTMYTLTNKFSVHTKDKVYRILLLMTAVYISKDLLWVRPGSKHFRFTNLMKLLL